MTPDSQFQSLIDNLKLPSPSTLKPWLQKLLANPGSVVIISIESPLALTGPRIGTAWLSEPERVKVRNALLAINSARTKKNQANTTEIPYLD